MSGWLAMVKVACGERRLTLPTAPSPVTTHCFLVSRLKQSSACGMRTLRDWVAGAAIVELLGASCVQGRWRVPGPRSAKAVDGAASGERQANSGALEMLHGGQISMQDAERRETCERRTGRRVQRIPSR